MDWEATGSAAQMLLNMLSRFGRPIDAETLLNYANQDDPEWRTRPGALLAHYRALDLLDLLNLAEKPDGTSRQLSPKGRKIVATPAEAFWTDVWSDPQVQEWAAAEALSSAASTDGLQRGENTFRSLELSRWRQFDDIALDFHPRLTILTGANGAGKTTLLNILAPHFSWSAQLISSNWRGPDHAGPALQHVGQLYYTNGARTPIEEPMAAGSRVSSLQMPSQQPVPGIFISSHRSISGYQTLQNLPAKFSTSEALLNQFAGELQSRYSGGGGQFPPLYRMKEALVAAAMYAYGNAAIRANDEAREIWEGFQIILRKLLPRALAFTRLSVDDGDVWMETASARFPIEAVSGGVSAMLELAWQIFLRGRDSRSFTVCIDEPENHLHPELQRTIMPALLDAFPASSFIVATHSPFVVTASRESTVHALTADERGVVTSRRLNGVKTAGTSDETLMTVLGLDTPLPLWAEDSLRDAIAATPDDPTADDLRNLREQLKLVGLDDQFPAAVAAVRESGAPK